MIAFVHNLSTKYTINSIKFMKFGLDDFHRISTLGKL